MSIAFNGFAAPIFTDGTTVLGFEAFNQPGGFTWRLIGSNLVYIAPGVITGVINGIILVDEFENVLQTITVEPTLRNAGSTGMAAQLTQFLTQARAAADATFVAWGLTAEAVVFLDGGTATAFRLELQDVNGNVTGYLDVAGSGFVPGNAQAGTVTSITLLDTGVPPVATEAAFFAGLPLNTLSYGLLVTSAAGAAEVGAVHAPLTQGANTVTGLSGPVYLDGGAGNDALVGSISGGPYGVSYDSLTSSVGVRVSLALATAQVTGGGGTDTLTRITNLEGSRFNDTLTGSAVANEIYGNDGNDDLFGGLGADLLYGGAGINALDGGAGADTFDGTGGFSAASYASSATAVGISLAGVRVGADAIGDVYVEIFDLIGSRFADTLAGDASDNVIEGGAGADVLDGGSNAGFGDTVSYARAAAAIRVDLSFEAVAQPSSSVGDAAGDRLSGFENAAGSAFNDTLIGDAGANRLSGGRGDDLLAGGLGADTLDGGAGIDTASYAASNDGVVVDLIGPILGGHAEGDVLTGIENLIGSAFDDNLYGFGIANRIDGGAGDDLVDGDVGNDTLIGGINREFGDTLSYGFATSGVTVSLALTTAQTTGGSGIDVISGFENLNGSAFNDTLTGTAARNFIYGGEGGDHILGGAGNDDLNGDDSDDTLEGGAGADDIFGGETEEFVGDTVSYAGSAAGVTIDLNLQLESAAQVSGGDAAGDLLFDIENIQGSRFADTLTGDVGDNIIEGGAGADTLVGGQSGGHGDTISYATSMIAVRVDLRNELQAATGAGDASGDRLIGFENVTGSAFNDTLIGDAGGNWLRGGAGNDLLGGGLGVDTLDGGAGTNDVADFSGATGALTVNLLTWSVTGSGLDGTELAFLEGAIGGSADDFLIAHIEGGTLTGGEGNDSVEASNFNDTLDGGANTLRDTLSYDRASAAVTVNLSLTTAQNTGGSGTDLIRGFEKLEGSSYNDTLTGDALANEIQGRAGADLISGLAGADSLFGAEGNDTLIGGAGADVLDGADDADTASYVTSAAGVNVSLVSGVMGLLGDAQGDTLSGIESLIGSRLADTLVGDEFDNVIEGGLGADRLEGGGAALGDGTGDTLSYATSTAAVNVNLQTGVGLGGDAAGDIIAGFENVTGSALNDTLIGNGVNNLLMGGLGNDALGGGVGTDTLNGGTGIDTADYSRNVRGVTVDLNAQTVFGDDLFDGFIQMLSATLISIESATGGSGTDDLRGDGGANALNGGAGDDTVEGGAGNDTLTGGLGLRDVLVYTGTQGVTLNLALTTAQSLGVFGTDLISGFEFLRTGGGADSLTGSLDANDIQAGLGNDTVFGLAGNDTIDGGAGNDLLFGGQGADSISGGTDNDTVSYVASAAGVNVDLQAGTGLNGDAAGDVLTGIENLIGSRLADTLSGDSGSNLIEGGAGADSLNGAAGTDTVSYAASTVGVNIGLLGAAGIGGDAAGDVLDGFENIIGSGLNDTLIGDSGANSLLGGAGLDVLRGGGGGDVLDGGAGLGDTVSYEGFAAAVTVNLTVPLATIGTGGDQLIDIENLVGGNGNDTLTGNALANRIDGSAGNDQIDGGGGVDTVAGGLGDRDLLVLGNAPSGVRINLSLTTAQLLGSFGSVTLLGIEDLRGTSGADDLTGSLVANVLEGAGGNDTLSGLAGNDTLRGDAGDDLLFGGAGADNLDGGGDSDTVSYAASAAGVSIELSGGALASTGGDAEGDVLVGIENLIGSGLADTLFGDTADNIIEGRAGADRLSGSTNATGLEAGDTVSYASSAAAVNVDLRLQGTQPATAIGAQVGGDAAGDLLSAFEKIIGSAFNDTLTGDSSINTLFGGRGNDVLRAIGDGDRLYGGDGLDTVTFAGETDNAFLLLANNIATFGPNGGNAAGLFSIENVTGGSGDDTLFGDDMANNLNGGDGDDVIEGGLGNDTLIGGVGRDNLIYGGPQAVTVSLSITTAQNLGAAFGIDLISGFEDLQSGGGNDSLTGSAGANEFFAQGGADTIIGLAGVDTIFGGEGNDLLIGGAGADSLFGEGGVDTASYAGSTVGVRIETSFGFFRAFLGDAEGDSLSSIENLTGSALADTLEGDANNNVIEGGAGADSLRGRDGVDTLSYAGSNAAVNVNLLAGTRTGGHATGDIATEFENVLGSAFNDTLTGDAGANRLTGGAGINLLEGGAGADTLDGTGSVNDTASYAGAAGEVTVNLLLATQVGTGDEVGDVLIGIENLLGGVGGDFLTGDAGNNRIDGGAGSDVIEGGVGNDTLIGGANGPDGDTVRYSNATGGVTVSLAIATAQNTGSAGNDVISGFEQLNGSTFADRLTGDALANTIVGSDGNDTISGGLGNDLLFGGNDADQFVFNTALGATNVDTLVAFQVGLDEIVLENAVFTALGLVPGALTDAQFALTTDVLTAADRIIYNQGTGALLYDRDGSGTAVAAVQFANVLGTASAGVGAVGLSASDFLII
jgi:Ca2+-binding RTX toxin-like protein